MIVLSAPLRWFWRAYIPFAAVALLGFVALASGPTLENRFRPIRGPDQRVEVIERTAARVCWRWTFTKLRDVASDNLDAFLVINGQPGGVAAPYDMDTGRPWGILRFAVPVRDEPYALRWCVALPPYLGPGDTVVVRQVAYYPGWMRLWRLPVPFPDVVSPGVPLP